MSEMQYTKSIEELITEVQAASTSSTHARNIALAISERLSTATLRRISVEFLVERARGRARREVFRVEREAVRREIMEELAKDRQFSRPRNRKLRQEWEATTEGQKYIQDIAKADAEINARFHEGIKGIIADFSRSLKMEWTAELLSSSFALRDGHVVTWGSATLGQHQERVDIFESNAVANAEGAARHRLAINEIEKSGTRDLNSAVLDVAAELEREATS